jgi:ABC-type glycerol-3-phosphate transport system substrate-binding protein
LRKLTAAILGSGLLVLAACGGNGDDAAGDNVADAAEAQADSLEEVADNTSDAAQADALENQADALEDAGEAKEEGIDDADVKVTNQQ